MIGLTKWNPADQWDPFKELEAMENRLGMLFGRLPGNRERKQEAMALTQWAPLVDITEDTKEYVVKAELPEMKKEEMKVSVENGVLSISGERSLEKEDKDRKFCTRPPPAIQKRSARCALIPTRLSSAMHPTLWLRTYLTVERKGRRFDGAFSAPTLPVFFSAGAVCCIPCWSMTVV